MGTTLEKSEQTTYFCRILYRFLIRVLIFMHAKKHVVVERKSKEKRWVPS